MQVYILCQKYPAQIIDVFSDAKAVREMIEKDADKYYCIEKTLIDSPVKMKSMVAVNEKVYDPKHFNDPMPFGKYKGKTIGDIIQEDPSYLSWCVDNLSFELDDECIELMECSLDKGKKK